MDPPFLLSNYFTDGDKCGKRRADELTKKTENIQSKYKHNQTCQCVCVWGVCVCFIITRTTKTDGNISFPLTVMFP